MNRTIILHPLDDLTAELLQSATIRTAEELNNHNPKQAAILRRIAMNLDTPRHEIGELTVVSAFLLQLAAQKFAAQASDSSHASVLYDIAQEITDKIHTNQYQQPCN